MRFLFCLVVAIFFSNVCCLINERQENICFAVNISRIDMKNMFDKLTSIEEIKTMYGGEEPVFHVGLGCAKVGLADSLLAKRFIGVEVQNSIRRLGLSFIVDRAVRFSVNLPHPHKQPIVIVPENAKDFSELNRLIIDRLAAWNEIHNTQYAMLSGYTSENYNPHITLIAANILGNYFKSQSLNENERSKQIDCLISEIEKALKGDTFNLPTPNYRYSRHNS